MVRLLSDYMPKINKKSPKTNVNPLSDKLKQIDQLIAEHIFGWKFKKVKPVLGIEGRFGTFKCERCGREVHECQANFGCRFTMSIEAAWTIVVHLNTLQFEIHRESCAGVRYDVTIYNDPNMKDKIHVTASSGPIAICLAALKFKGIKV